MKARRLTGTGTQYKENKLNLKNAEGSNEHQIRELETFIYSTVYLFSLYYCMERCIFCFDVNEESARPLFCGAGIPAGAAIVGGWVTICSVSFHSVV